MSIWSNSAEGGTNGTTVTVANSGSASGDAFYSTSIGSGATAIFSSATSAHGNLSYAITCPSGIGAYLQTNHYSADASQAFAVRFYINFATLPTTASAIATVYDAASASALQLIINGTGKLYIQGVAGGTIGTMPVALSANTWYRVEMQGTIGTTTSNSSVNVDYYLLDSTTSLGNIASTTANFGTSTVSFISIGKLNPSGTYAGTIYFDDIVFADATTTPIGPYVVPNNPPTSSAGSNQVNIEPYVTVTLSGTDGDSDGTVVSRQWVQVSGSPSVTITGATSATATYMAPGTIAGTTLTFGYQVTDNGGASSTQSTVQNVILPVTERAVVGGVEVPVRTAAIRNGSEL